VLFPVNRPLPHLLGSFSPSASLFDFASRLFILGAVSGDVVMERSMGKPVFSINFPFSYFQRLTRDGR
jgi:hypothetical protein